MAVRGCCAKRNLSTFIQAEEHLFLFSISQLAIVTATDNSKMTSTYTQENPDHLQEKARNCAGFKKARLQECINTVQYCERA